jgi:heme-degrading monooxygenase HmoA
MLALFFEMHPKPGHMDHYFRHVAMLKPELEKHDGLMWLDRFTSLTQDSKILSHQLWEDEAAIIRWRENHRHMGSQNAGREKHFADYRIRIIEVAYHAQAGEGAYSFPFDEASSAEWVVAGHAKGKALAGGDEQFNSVNHEDAFVTLASVADEGEAMSLAGQWDDDEAVSWIIAGKLIRDYGMHDRAQAPHP